MKPLVVISFYDRRPVEPLVALLDSLDAHAAGRAHERVICVNSTGAGELPAEVASRVDGVLVRPNRGMNIGAWDAAWRHWPDRPAYLFLQDECHAVRDDWLAQYLGELEDPNAGLVGEALNAAWDKPWEALREGPGKDRLPEHMIDGAPANRVDVYLHHMRNFGIDPGVRGRHLRSLAWAVRNEVLAAIGGFASGNNYGECIAAEIGASRAVEAMGLEVRQVAPVPFHVFRHREWHQDQPGGAFTHKPVMLRELQRLRDDNAALRRRVDSPTLGDVGRAIVASLGRARKGRP